MTLIVGIVCKDGIVVAGDSQTTWDTGKSWLSNKMTELKHPYGRGLVAESGAAVTSAAVIEELQRICDDRTVFDAQSMRGCAALAVRSVREKLREQQFNCSAEEFQEYLFREELECQLMIAHYENGPKIDTIRLSVGIANRAKSFFEAVGSGSDLADYLLTDLCTPEMECKTASVVAVHVIETAKRHDPYCGGPTKLGVLRLPPELPRIQPPSEESHLPSVPHIPDFIRDIYAPPLILSQSEVEEIVKMVQEVDQINKENRKFVILGKLKEHSEARMKEIMETMWPTDDKPHDREADS